jgi:uncharacterized protein (TIGR00369 family)
MLPITKTVADSRFTLSALMSVQHANSLGNVHGGSIMKLVDEAGAIVAMRHAGLPVVTVAIDSMTFLKPIVIGDLVQCQAEITYVGKTSMEVRVEVIAEKPYEAKRSLTNTAYLVYVALDESGNPHAVPDLEFTTSEQRQRAQLAAERQKRRKAQRQMEISHE